MAKTSNSAATPYATPNDMLARMDLRLVGDLVRDDGTQATASDLQTDVNLATALAGASGQVESACLAGEFYSVADLQALTGASLAMLKDIVCWLAYGRLRRRRGVSEASDDPAYAEAKKLIDDLHDGKRIFAFAETEAAGLPKVSRMTQSDWQQGLPSLLTNNERVWGVRSNRLPGLG